MFPEEVEDGKSRVQALLDTPEIKLEDHYHATGYCQAVARAPWFTNITLAVILFNTLWIAVDTDLNHAQVILDANPVFQVADNMFTLFFLLEISVRLFAFKDKSFAFTDANFVFDFCLVDIMVWETWVNPLLILTAGGRGQELLPSNTSSFFRVLRLLRLSRAFRATRLIRYVPEVMFLAKGLAAAIRSVLAVLGLLFVVIYVFAILFVQMLGPPAGEKDFMDTFPNVLHSMNFLFTQVLCGFDADFHVRVLAKGLIFYLFFVIFQMLASLTIMNMLIGVLCDVVSTVAETEKEQSFIQDVEQHLQLIQTRLDSDGNGFIEEKEFQGILEDKLMTKELDELGVDVVSLADFAKFLFRQTEEITHAEFRHMVLQFRGNKNVTVKDLVDMRRFVSQEMIALEEMIEKNAATIEKNALKIRDLQDSWPRLPKPGKGLTGAERVANDGV